MPRLPVLLLIAYWAALFVATHVPLPEMPGSGFHLDKVFHFVAYALLAVLLAWTLSARASVPRRRVYALTLVVAVVYGAIDELLQGLVPGRTPHVLDWLADVAGAAAGLGLFHLADVARGRGRGRPATAGSSQDAQENS